jgi:hypothetical protein
MKRHPFDVTSLISGLVFAIVAGVYLVAAANGQYIDGRWLLPLALIGLGIAGVAGAIAAAARQQRSSRPVVESVATDDDPEQGTDQADRVLGHEGRR